MTQHKFEGEIENITAPQLEFIKNVIEQEGSKYSKVTFEAVGGAADNYSANVKRIVIEGENGNSTMIAKIAPTNEVFRNLMRASLMFNNEQLMYTEVLLKLLQLQKQAEVPEDDLLKFPKCYGASVEAPNEVVLLEDLKAAGFNIMERFKCFSNEHVTSVLRNLAIFHSLSYVLKTKEPETYNYYKDNLQDRWVAKAKGTADELALFQQIETVFLNVLEDSEHQNIMRNKVRDIPVQAVKMTKFESGSRYAVIQHGDCWTNNIMFKLEKNTLKQSILIDYQLSNNCSPVYDLLYMIFNCTDHETRVKYFYDWINFYHSELDKSLSNYGLKVNYVYPRDQLDADLKRYGRLAFGSAIAISGILTVKPEEASKFKKACESTGIDEIIDTMSNLHVDTISHLKKRLIGLVESFTALGLL